jgi:trans-2,3-dihydro-3-hydroxyanthranilate isomerase
MSRFAFTQVDVFSATALRGNPLAVVHGADALDDERMQAFACWTNLSETTFLLAPTDPAADYRLRIFTPGGELPFAGHPTLGAAFVLGGPLSKLVIRIETDSGVVPVELTREGPRIVFGEMEQPIPPWEVEPNPEPIFAALGVAGSELRVERYALGPGHVYVALGSPEEVAGLRPDLVALERATGDGVNCFAHVAGPRWKTRMFAPGHGVGEDPATGSAAGPLAIHLARHGRIAFGERIEIAQGAELQRPSTLFAQVEGEGDRIERVRVGGSAVVVARGEFSF